MTTGAVFATTLLVATAIGLQAQACPLNSTQNQQDKSSTQASAPPPNPPSSAKNDNAQPVGKQATNQTTSQRPRAQN